MYNLLGIVFGDNYIYVRESYIHYTHYVYLLCIDIPVDILV